MPWTALIALQDSLVDCCDVLLGLYIHDSLGLGKTPMFDQCVEVMRAMQTVAMIGPYCYNVFKAWYAISVGKTINYLDPTIFNNLFNTVYQDLPDCPLKQ